jgi:hypothetical protein
MGILSFPKMANLVKANTYNQNVNNNFSIIPSNIIHNNSKFFNLSDNLNGKVINLRSKG